MLNRITIEDNEEYLRQTSVDVDFKNDDYKKYIDALSEFCQSNEVYALAPVQIGIPKRIIYIRNTSSDMTKNNKSYNEGIVYINPVIKKMYGHTKFLEGCGSCKYTDGNYVVGIVDRPYRIDVEYFDMNATKHEKTVEGFESTIFCHEYDHLNGILHMDRIKESTKMTLGQMKEFRTNTPYEVIDKDKEFEYESINREGKEMDYRYETKDEARSFHQQRKAFIIYNNEVEFLPEGSAMSHYEYCQTKGMEKEEFNKITRGFYLNGNLIFYKDNFIYDEGLIKEALAHLDEIAAKLDVKNFEMYFGVLPEQNFAYDNHYGKYENGKVVRIEEEQER